MTADLICLSHLRWGFVYQRPNHLMSRCARDRRVFFVEEPHFDVDVPFLDIQHVEHGLHLAIPHLPPGQPQAIVEGMQRVMIDSLVERMHVRDPLLWFYTPMAVRHVEHIAPSGVVYDCMDELSHFHGAPPELVERERHLFKIADLVFTGGHSLFEKKRDHHPSVHAFPSSVDFAHYERARGPMADPDDQVGIPHPRLGFFGVVDERMDLELIAGIADARPEMHLVILGPVVKIDPDRLPRRPNIHWLGGKDYKELPAYIRGWDVAIMPFARNEATRFISPTKTLEYLAAGKPVVSTSIRDVVRPYGEDGLVRIADTPGAFVAAVDVALAERGTARAAAHAAARDAMLAQTSWDATWSRMHGLLSELAIHRDRGLARRRHVRKEEEEPCSTT